MSATSRRTQKIRSRASTTRAEPGRDPDENVSRDEAIRCRAYELYLERGEQPGSALEDWLRAERELGRTSCRRTRTGGPDA
jgi:Protein of unknown function (DUF2934)